MNEVKDKVSEVSDDLIGEAVGRDILIAEVRAWVRRIGVKGRIKEVYVGPIRRKWASISTRGRLTLNTDLLTQRSAFRGEVLLRRENLLPCGQGRRNMRPMQEELGQRRRARSEFEKLYAENPDYKDVAARLGL